MSSSSEAELMRQVRDGNRNAYRQLLDQQLPSVTRYVMRMTGTNHEAEDITQEVFLRLWTHAGRFNAGKAKLTTWLHNIAHNLCIDYFRKSGRLVGEDFIVESGGGVEPEQDMMDNNAATRVHDALMQIPERQRSAIVMCHYQELSNKEAAAVMEISVDALESLLARGRRNLKTLLNIDE